MASNGYDRPIIIKRVKKHHTPHHGGAWKIAYADFVTAMMAFFLLLWLISMTTPEQKKGLADYFAPASASESVSGAGGVLAGKAFDVSGAKTTDAASVTQPGVPASENSARLAAIQNNTGDESAITVNESSRTRVSNKDMASEFSGEFASAAASIKQAWQSLPNVTEVENNLRLEETPEGLNIQIIDDVGRPMFPEGSKYPFEATRKAIAAIAPVLQSLPNQIEISGHTAAGGTYTDPRYGPWELTSDRANMVRTILGEFGLSDDHVVSVAGRATSAPLLPSDPYLAANERIQITLRHAAPPVPPNMAP
jgi:chemotaxis protein MotB